MNPAKVDCDIKRVTVEDVNEVLIEKGLEIYLPYPGGWVVTGVQILEKEHDLNGRVTLLLSLQIINDVGKGISELWHRFC
jgi:hypothetical protein